MIDFSVQEGVAVLTLNDPPANTYSHEMMRELDGHILDARFDPAAELWQGLAIERIDRVRADRLDAGAGALHRRDFDFHQ